MNDQKIYECIALNGPMTAAALAQELGVDVDDAIEHLAALRGVGDLVLADGVYSFSRGFSISEDGRRARARADAITQGRAGAGTCVTDRALNFLIARGGRCASWELHKALELGADELTSVVLADALVAGRLFKEGKEFFVDRRTMPREYSAAREFEADLMAEPARRVEQIAGPGTGVANLRMTRVVPVNESITQPPPALDWVAVQNSDTDE